MIGNASVDARKWNEGSITERHSGWFYMPDFLLVSVRTGLSNFLKRGKTGNFLAKKGPLRIACEDGTTFGVLPPLLENFQKRFPAISCPVSASWICVISRS